MHVAVIQGGWSSEREVSLRSGAAVVSALRVMGHQVTDIDMGSDLAEKLRQARPDVAFIALHGTWGEDGCVQGLLECLKIPYTHSGVRASAMAMHKPTAKILFQTAGIPVAEGKMVHRNHLYQGGKWVDPMERPYVLKPPGEGSSVGIRIVQEGDDVSLDDEGLPDAEFFLVEEYIRGQEITVAVQDGVVLGSCEIQPKAGFYDYRNKYTAGMTEYLVPAPVSEDVQMALCRHAEAAHIILGCRGVTRSDFRYDASRERLVILEVNTHPGFTETSLVPKIAAHAGLSFATIIERLLLAATLDNA